MEGKKAGSPENSVVFNLVPNAGKVGQKELKQKLFFKRFKKMCENFRVTTLCVKIAKVCF